MTRPLLIVVGPTAVGKSSAVLDLCEAVGGELVSADSGQVYRGLDIGSAKPSAEEQARVPHHGIDLCPPTEQLDVARWLAVADAAIADARSRGAYPVVCGGTGFYLRALLHGLSPIPDVDPTIRAAVREEIAERGPRALHAELETVDPAAAARIALADRQRIGRALEVWRQTGRPLSDWQRAHAFAARRYPDARIVALWPERPWLHARIGARVDAMLARGWVAEVEALRAAGVPDDAPGFQTLGYRDVVAMLRGELARADLAAQIATGHRRYARRQLTWFRGVLSRDDGPLIRLDPAVDRVQDRLRALVAEPAPGETTT